MVKMSYDVVKRWVNEAQEAASSDNIMVQVENKDMGIDLEIHICDVYNHLLYLSN